jgi:hypothetical protein
VLQTPGPQSEQRTEQYIVDNFIMTSKQETATQAEQPRPVPLRVKPETIPAELKARAQWVLWRYAFRKGEWTKPPYTPDDKPADSTDPATWSSFDAVMTAGFVLANFVQWEDDPANPRPKKGHVPKQCKGELARGMQSSGGGGDRPPSGKGGEESATPAAVILAWLRETLCPHFRRSARIYSARWCRDLSRTDVVPTSTIIDQLADAGFAPMSKQGMPDLDALPKVFRDWLPVAWGDLLASLKEETATVEIVSPAEEEFCARLREVFLTPIALAYTYSEGGEEREEVRRDPVIVWARRFAKSPHWAKGQLRGYQVWSKKEGERVSVAFRAGLIGQLHCRGWGGPVNHHHLSNLCSLYSVGTPCKVLGGVERAIQLADEFLADLLDIPADTDEQTAPPLACEGGTSDRPGSR